MPGLVALALAYVFSQFYRSFLAVITPQLGRDIGASAADLSNAAGLWFVVFAAMQFAVGPALDRFGPRRTAGWLFGVAGGAGALLFAAANTPGAIVLAMGLLGIACSPVLMASLFIFARRADPARLAILISWLVAFGNLGNVIGTAPLASAVEAFGWRATIATLGGLTVLLAIAIGRLVEDPPLEATDGTGLAGYLTLLRIPALWLILPLILLCYAPVANLRGLWVGPYLADLHGADSLAIGRVTLWMALAMVAGSVAYGPLDRWFGTRKGVALVGSALTLLALGLFVLDPVRTPATATALFVAIGLTGVSYGVLMAHGRAFVPQPLLGRGVTLLNFCSIAGAGVLQFVSGARFAAHPDPGSSASYRALFLSYAVLLALTLALYAFSRDAKPGATAAAASAPPRG